MTSFALSGPPPTRSPESTLAELGTATRAPNPGRSLSLLTTATIGLALTLLLVFIWLLTHRYQGLAQDARLYAVQALSTLNPALKGDLYLQNTSQDHYTVFSPFYGAVIRLLGLHDAARALTLLFAAVFLTAAWQVADGLLGKGDAWLAVGTLILTVGAYGSYGVFHFAEDYLTARSAAEALVVTALAMQLRGHGHAALCVAVIALLVHPLMALPGMLMLIVMRVPTHIALALLAAGIVTVVAIAVGASNVPRFQKTLPTMDALWLQIVMERSQFLFLQLWSLRDWEVNLRPFATLALASMVLSGNAVRTVCMAAAWVGGCGLIVAGLAGVLGPIALLVEGQAWRWVWISALISAMLVLPTAMRLWRNDGMGPLCAAMLLASWTLTNHAASLSWAGLAVFLLRIPVSDGCARYVKIAALSLGSILLVGELVAFTSGASSARIPVIGGSASSLFQQTRLLAIGRLPLMLLLMLIWQIIRTARSHWLPLSFSLALGTGCIFLVPVAFARQDTAGSSEVEEFADWRAVIPAGANVYVANGYDAAPFAWFTLGRPNYLSLDQSAGVVFSRATALEVKRRSEILLPLMDEDWKLLSRNRTAGEGSKVTLPRRTPLTADALVRMCRDPQLGYLVAREDVGFEPLRHRHAGRWMNWNLYDCRHVRDLAPAI